MTGVQTCALPIFGTIAGRTDQYVEASHIQSEMLCHLDQHLWSRPGGTESSDSAEAERMCSGIGSLGASGWVVQGLDGYAGLGVHYDSLCHCGCRS